MFFMVRGATNRTYSRKALGIKSLVVSEDIVNGSPIDIQVDEVNSAFIVEKIDKKYVGASDHYIEDFDTIQEEEIQILTNRFSPVVNFGRNFERKTAIEVTFMDGYMLVNLISGAIFIDNPADDGDSATLLAYRNVPELSYGRKSVSSEVNWVDMDKLKRTLSAMYSIDMSHMNDYVFEFYIDAESAGSSKKGEFSSAVSYGKRDYFDISLGNIKPVSREKLELKKESVGDNYTIPKPVYEDDDCENLGVGSTYEEDDEYEDEDDYYDDYEEPEYIDYGAGEDEDEVSGFHVVGGSDENV